jgi:type II secretory pathway pseudopilin PulG
MMIRSSPGNFALLSRHARRMRPRGFNFTEVLFAVMILGIGFIMVAAIFPVALMQTKTTQEETAAAAIARGGANYLQSIATDANLPASGNRVRSLAGSNALRGMMTLSGDSRFAWVPFYRRAGTVDPANPLTPQPDWSPVAQVYMIPVASRNRGIYDKGSPRVVANYTPGPNYGTSVMIATIADSTSGNGINQDQVDCIEFPSGQASNDTNDNYTTVGPGAYVIVDQVPSLGGFARNGHMFRIGNPTKTQPSGATYPRRWELVPGMDYTPLLVDLDDDGRAGDASDPGEIPLELVGCSVLVVGREAMDPTLPVNAGNPREGLGQDISAYTTYVNIH